MHNTTRTLVKDGFKYIKLGMPDLAEKVFCEALRKDPSDTVKLHIGMAYCRLGNIPKAGEVLSGIDNDKARRVNKRLRPFISFDPIESSQSDAVKPQTFRSKFQSQMDALGISMIDLSSKAGLCKQQVYKLLDGGYHETRLMNRTFGMVLQALSDLGASKAALSELKDSFEKDHAVKPISCLRSKFEEVITRLDISYIDVASAAGIGKQKVYKLMDLDFRDPTNANEAAGQIFSALKKLGASKSDISQLEQLLASCLQG